ncbi:glycosyltransferase family 39 protein [Candidatus Woesearchaeota archaeon]|nr:glycosyltransferase family 39 protein [Candidatus Woesearchaeota archaeon]
MAASLFAILLFFVYTWGLGFSATRLARESEHFLERNLMRLGIGFSAFTVLGMALNAFRIPLDWRVFLFASVAVPLYCLIFRKGYRQLNAPSLRLRLSDVNVLILLLVFAFTAYMYISGAFSYAYLEDDDSWTHVRGIAYVSIEKTAFASQFFQSQYMDPYPPGYDMFFGVLNQVSSSVYWVVKFFNALVISLSIIFFYFFAKEFMGSSKKALFATFVLASVPAYLSHFIWAPAFALVAFFPAMYAFEMIRHGRKWWVVAAICFASVLLIHPTHAVKLSVFVAIYLGIKLLSGLIADNKSWVQQNAGSIKAAILGVLLSLFWWGFKWRVFASKAAGSFKDGPEAATAAIRQSPNVIVKLIRLVTHALNPDSGTATRVYTFRDFFIAQSQNMVNNPVGFGVFAFILMAAGLVSAVLGFVKLLPRPRVVIPVAAVVVIILVILLTSSTLEFQQGFYGRDGPLRPQNWVNPPSYGGVFAISLVLVLLAVAFLLSVVAVIAAARRNAERRQVIYLAILLGWLLFAFLGVNNQTFDLPVGLFAFRFWMILAVPAAMLASEGLFALLGLVSRFKLDASAVTAVKLAIIAVFVVGIFFTSAKPKLDLNTACWPSGAFWGGNYVLEQGSNCPVPSELLVYGWLRTLPPNTKVFTFSNPDQVIGSDKYSCGWCEPEYRMRQRFFNVTPSELHSFLRDNSYDYFIIGGIEVKNFGLNRTVSLINAVASSGLFTIANQGEAAFVFTLT